MFALVIPTVVNVACANVDVVADKMAVAVLGSDNLFANPAARLTAETNPADPALPTLGYIDPPISSIVLILCNMSHRLCTRRDRRLLPYAGAVREDAKLGIRNTSSIAIEGGTKHRTGTTQYRESFHSMDRGSLCYNTAVPVLGSDN